MTRRSTGAELEDSPRVTRRRGGVGDSARARSHDAATPALVDRDAAAALLGTSARHIRRLVQERRIPYYRIGGKVRFSPTELQAWVESMAIRPTTRIAIVRRGGRVAG
jgi:excisionase family DNA binding protein